MIGFGTMGRAELFFVVLELCYVQHHIMTREQLCTFAFVAMLMNVSVPVSIALYKPYYCKWTGHDAEAEIAARENPGGDHGHSQVDDDNSAEKAEKGDHENHNG